MQIQGKLFLIFAVIFLVLVLKYQDSDGFQSLMHFLFSPDKIPALKNALPEVWLQYRLVMIAAMIGALAYLYRPVWSSYMEVIKILRDATPSSTKPSLSPLKASYLYRQERNIFKVWLLELCISGVISLHHDNGVYPWSICRGDKSPVSDLDRQLFDRLFQEAQHLRLKGSGSDPNTHVKHVFQTLRKHLEKNTKDLLKRKMSCIPLYLLLGCFILEIPFLMAANEIDNQPQTIVVTIFASFFIAFPIYALCTEIYSLVDGPRNKALLMIGGSACITMMSLAILYGAMEYKFQSTMIYIPFLMAMVVIVTKAPPHVIQRKQLLQVIAYKKFLNMPGTVIGDKELPWTIGLDVQTDTSCTLNYVERFEPKWLHTGGAEPQRVIRKLHETLDRGVRDAIYGELKSRKHHGGIGNMGRSG